MKKIVFFARDPGGANSLIPIIHQLKGNYECFIFAKDYAKTIFSNHNINFKEIIEFSQIEDYLLNSNLIITGTSFEDYVEHDIWIYSFANNLDCIAYLDHWMGYNRFYNKNFNKYIFPSKLLVIDTFAKKKIEEKFSDFKVKVEVVGSMFLEQIIKNKLSSMSIIEYKKKYNMENSSYIFSYAAEMIKGVANNEEKYGFNEFSQFVKLKDMLNELNINCHLFFIPHPKHNLNNVKKELEPFINNSLETVNVTINESHSKDNLIQISDKVFGINTMVLVEAMILGISSCSIYVDFKNKSDFLLLDKGFIYLADNKESLKEFILDRKKVIKYDDSLIRKSTSKFLEVINNYV